MNRRKFITILVIGTAVIIAAYKISLKDDKPPVPDDRWVMIFCNNQVIGSAKLIRLSISPSSWEIECDPISVNQYHASKKLEVYFKIGYNTYSGKAYLHGNILEGSGVLTKH